MKDILVIGTEPQCPRCKLLSNIMEDLNRKHGLKASVRHCAYDTEEAQCIGMHMGLEANTAKEVANRLNRPIDKERVQALCQQKAVDPDSEWAWLNDCSWSQELDDALRFYQESARATGVLMTPVLVVDGAVVWEGSVPGKEDLESLLDLEMNREEECGNEKDGAGAPSFI